MSTVTIEEQGQISLSPDLLAQLGVKPGDVLEAHVDGNTLTLSPPITIDQAELDRRIAEGLEDVRQGRVHGPYSTAEEVIAALHREGSKYLRESSIEGDIH